MGWVNEHVRVEVAPSDTPFAFLPTWVPIPNAEWRTIEWVYDRDSPTGQCSPAQLRVVVDNISGRWDPSTGLGGSPWAGSIERWKQIRVQVSTDNFAFTSTRRFRGYITDVVVSSDPHDATATITATCQLGVAAEYNLEDLVRPAELAGVRASAILDAVGLPALASSLEQPGTVALEAATLSGQALSAAQECARAEGGHLWVTPSTAGLLMFTDRHYFYDTFSKSDFPLGPAELKAVRIPQSLQAFDNVSVGAASGASGVVKKFGSAASGYPSSTKRELSTSAVWDADSESLAEWLQRHGNFSGSRVLSVVCDVLGTNTNVLTGLVDGTLKWLDKVEVEFTPPHGATVSQRCWVESESHQVSAVDGTWRLTLGLSPFDTDYANVTGTALRFGETIGSKVPGV